MTVGIDGFVLCSIASTWHVKGIFLHCPPIVFCDGFAFCSHRRWNILSLLLPVLYRYFYQYLMSLVLRRGVMWLGVSLCVKIFNVYGTRPYVMFLTSRTSSYVLFLLAAFLPFHISRYLRSRNFTLPLPLVQRTFNGDFLAIVTWSSTVTKFT